MVATKQWIKNFLKKAKEEDFFKKVSEPFIKTLVEPYVYDHIYYKPGDTITITGIPILPSILAYGHKTFIISIPVRKRIDDINSITCTEFKANTYLNRNCIFGSYVSGGLDMLSLTRTSLTIVKVPETNTIKITFVFPSTVISGTAGWPCMTWINRLVLKLN